MHDCAGVRRVTGAGEVGKVCDPVGRDAASLGIKGADMKLRPRIAGFGQRLPDGECLRVVAGAISGGPAIDRRCEGDGRSLFVCRSFSVR